MRVRMSAGRDCSHPDPPSPSRHHAGMTPDQQRAADLLGRGLTRKAAAAEAGVAPRTVSRWRQDEDFEALVRRSRESLLDDRPTVRSTLEAALLATRRDGSPDWNARVQAARILMTAPVEDEPDAERTVITVYEAA